MNFNRSIVVPLTAAVLFGIGYLISLGVGLAWHGMPVAVKWAIPVVLVLWYLYDAMRREQGGL